METSDEEYEVESYPEKDSLPAAEGSSRSRNVRDRIEYWDELRRLRRLLDDPSFSDL